MSMRPNVPDNGGTIFVLSIVLFSIVLYLLLSMPQ